MKRKIILRIGLLIFSCVVGLLLSEIAISRLKPQITFSESVKNSIDCYAQDPDMTFTLGQNYRCKMINLAGEFNTTATLNRLGYRGENFNPEKTNGMTRVLVVGDSMTFGWGLPDESTYPFLMQSMLGSHHTQVVNAGYKGGLSPDSFYIYLNRDGLKLSADIVVVSLFLWNDVTDIAANRWDKLDSEGLPLKLSSCCHEVDGRILRNIVLPPRYRIPILRDSHLYLMVEQFMERAFHVSSDPTLLSTRGEIEIGCVLNPGCIEQFSSEERSLYKILDTLKRSITTRGGKLLVTLIPVDVQLYPQSWEKYKRFNMKWFPPVDHTNFIGDRIAGNLKKSGIEVLDLYDSFDKNRSLGYPFFPMDAHLNPIGTKITAKAISEFLLEKKWIAP